MSRVDELIKKLCPNGVEYIQLGHLEDSGAIQLGRGKVISKKAIAESPGPYPVYSSSASFNGEFGRCSEYMFEDERITWSIDGGGRFFYRPPHKYSVTNVCGWLSVKGNNLDTRYLFYVLDHSWAGKSFDYTKKAHPSTIRVEYTIPVPPLEIQQEIARILDKFTQLEARRKQYAYYRETILGCPAVSGKFVELGQLGRIVTGKTPRSKDALAWGDSLDFVTPSDISIGMKYVRSPKRRLSDEGMKSLNKSVLPADSILVTCIGADMGKTVINGDQCVTNQQINAIILNPEVNVGYLYHVLSSMRPKLLQLGSIGGGTMPILNKTSFSKVKVPLPPLAKQREVAAILDKFDALVNDISTGLPAEIAARRKQYEYYRDKLLSFEPV